MTCARPSAALLLVLSLTTFTVFIICGNKMTVAGLPLPLRQEHVRSAGSQDILAGKDFLSVFLKSSAYDGDTYDSGRYGDSEEELQAPYDDFVHLTQKDTTFFDTTTEKSTGVSEETTMFDSYIRTSRQAVLEDEPSSSSSTERQSSISISNSDLVTISTSDSPSSEESVIVAVRVSSSVDRQINKNNNQFQPKTKTIFSTSQTINQFKPALGSSNILSSNAFSDVPHNNNLDVNNAQTSVIANSDFSKAKNLKEAFSDKNSFSNVFVEKQQPSLIARSSKSELNVNEAEPITRNRENRNNRDLSALQPNTGYTPAFHQSGNYPSLLQNLPTAVNIPFNLSDFLKSNEKQGSQLKPFHHSFIYHDAPQDPHRGRSVSYSTLIQAVSPEQEKPVQRIQETRYDVPSPSSQQDQDYANPFQALNTQSQDAAVQTDYSAQFSSTRSTPLAISSSTSITVLGYQESSSYSPVNGDGSNQWSQAYNKNNLESSTNNNDWASAYSSTKTDTSTAVNNNNENSQWGKFEGKFFSLSGPPKNEQQPNNPANPPKIYGRPEQNYEIDEAVSVHTNGRTHGIQAKGKNAQEDTSSTEKPKEDTKDKDKKTGYVVEGRNYRRYRVEEKTPDGFIVGEYGVVSNDDGSLRGVRYTADGSINPSVIYNALMKFLSL